MRTIFIYSALASISLLSGCASIVSGQHQSLSVATPGCEKANCELQNDEGKWYVPITPGTVTVNRSYQELLVKCAKEGHEAATVSVKSTTKGLAFGNILLGGIIGAGVDMASGAAYDYPTEISVPMSCDVKKDATLAQAPLRTDLRPPVRLGCTVKTVTPDVALAAGLSEPSGVLVTEVAPDGPAWSANVAVGDILVKLNDRHIPSTEALLDMLAATPPDGRLSFVAFREKQYIIIELLLDTERGI